MTKAPHAAKALSFPEQITIVVKQYEKLNLFWVKVDQQKFTSAKKIHLETILDTKHFNRLLFVLYIKSFIS